jgi:hypothetical protein
VWSLVGSWFPQGYAVQVSDPAIWTGQATTMLNQGSIAGYIKKKSY